MFETPAIKTEDAYSSALDYAKSHYENFPVVSFLIPKNLQKHVAIIYWFARTADDLADEGEIAPEKRLQNLNEFEQRLTNLLNGIFNDDFDKALSLTISDRNLTSQLFYDLLSAFKQDVVKKRYTDFEEMLDYARRSANPVGRLILELFEIRDDEAFRYSDLICSALQFANFAQDTAVDFKKGRIYLPLDEMEKYGVGENLFDLNEKIINFKRLMKFQVERINSMFDEGRNLLKFLKGRLRFEIAWTLLGGVEILNKIELSDYNVISERPVLQKIDFVKLLCKALVIR